MKVEEDQLLGELEELRAQVKDLRSRVRALEAEPAAPEPAEEREGDFGPAIKRSAPAGHRSAVNKALTMIGVLPARPEPERNPVLTAAHKRALAKMRNLSDDGADAPAEAEPAPAPAVPEQTTKVVPEEGAIVPLPEIREESHRDTSRSGESMEVELDDVLSIDLVRQGSRAAELILLLGETVAVAALLLSLPPHIGVLAATGFVLLVAASPRLVLRAHARFLTLVVCGRCLFPDVWALADTLRLPALAAACLPAFAFVFAGRIGWVVQALAMAAVAGAAAMAQGLPMIEAAGVGAVALGVAMLWRRAGR